MPMVPMLAMRKTTAATVPVPIARPVTAMSVAMPNALVTNAPSAPRNSDQRTAIYSLDGSASNTSHLTT
jgi:hypothetical protein